MPSDFIEFTSEVWVFSVEPKQSILLIESPRFESHTRGYNKKNFKK